MSTGPNVRAVLRHPTRTTRALSAIALVALPALATACGDDAEGADVPVLAVTTGDAAGDEMEYHFDLPAEVVAGPTRLTIRNEGSEPHHAQVFRLDDGATVDHLAAALADGGPPAAEEHGTFLGGTGLVSPGEESRADALIDLAPGQYALICFVDDPAGVPHVAHGMLQPFSVAVGDDLPDAPPADAEVRLVDYAFDLPEQIDGEATLTIDNRSGAEAHEMVIVRLDDGTTVNDVLAALHDGGPPPGTAVGGMQALPPGQRQQLQLDLEPGRYAVLCAVPSPDGTAHFDAGMIDEVEVT